MQRADQHAPNTATAVGAATAVRRRRSSKMRSRPQPRGQELAALEWQRDGACHQADQSVFFAPDTPGEPRAERSRRIMAAKRVCAQCPVLEPCRDYALENREEFGVWGGLSEADRRNLIAARRRTPERAGHRTPVENPTAVSLAGRV
jgi:WhiB family redox-sensing transcriptional regulator